MSARVASTRVWTEAGVRALGVRTDFRTACSVAGVGYTKGKELLSAGEFPVRVLRLGRTLVVPVRELLDLLGIEPAEKGSGAASAEPDVVDLDRRRGRATA